MSPNRRILIIEDEISILTFLRVSLESAGYSVKGAPTGKDGIREAVGFRPDAIILDLGLPDMDGMDVLKKIREWSKVPVIVLTVKEEMETKVSLLDAGADDYLTKPFSLSELTARLRVMERHQYPKESPLFKSGPIEVDLASRSVKSFGQEVRLTSTEFDILKLFIKHAGKVVTHRQILKEIWGPNSVEHTQYLRVYVGHLRKKLEPKDDSIKLILTEAGVGYRLMLLD